jgi:predicted DNA-binding transcriptional regulator YafY
MRNIRTLKPDAAAAPAAPPPRGKTALDRTRLFGIQTGNEAAEDIELVFDPPISKFIHERTWPGQEGTARMEAQFRCRLKLRLVITPEFESWLLGWGELLEVVRPASLRTSLRNKAAAMVRKHDPI